MAMKTSLWIADGNSVTAVEQSALDSEKRLEDWICKDLTLLGENLMLIGRQVQTTSGPLDILAMDGDGNLVLAELKRRKTPRDVVAQVLDYASWISERRLEDVEQLIRSFRKLELSTAFHDHFGYDLPETSCERHRLLIVAAELDDASERILRYLQEIHEIDINAVFFSVFKVAGQQVLVRAWLADPVEAQKRAEKRGKRPWSGVWFVNLGLSEKRDWNLCRKHGFVSAGGGEYYWRQLQKLEVGATIAAYAKKKGYVGVGTVTKSAEPADKMDLDDGVRLSDVAPTIANLAVEEGGEYAVGVKWSKTVDLESARTFEKAFANQAIVCKLRHEQTLAFLANEFGLSES